MALPRPEPGLVLNYRYLWQRERQHGAEEGRKARPSVVVLAVERGDGQMRVVVLPVTHSRPAEPDAGVELPPAVKRHLGLDDTPSWIVVSEGNDFVWPGYDLWPRRDGTFAYGFLPPRLFARVRAEFLAYSRRRKVSLTSRK